MARTSEFPGTASLFDELLGASLDEDGGVTSFTVRRAEDLQLQGKSLSEAVLEHYAKTGALIVGVVDRKTPLLVPDLVPGEPLGPDEQVIVLERASYEERI